MCSIQLVLTANLQMFTDWKVKWLNFFVCLWRRLWPLSHCTRRRAKILINCFVLTSVWTVEEHMGTRQTAELASVSSQHLCLISILSCSADFDDTLKRHCRVCGTSASWECMWKLSIYKTGRRQIQDLHLTWKLTRVAKTTDFVHLDILPIPSDVVDVLAPDYYRSTLFVYDYVICGRIINERQSQWLLKTCAFFQVDPAQPPELYSY